VLAREALGMTAGTGPQGIEARGVFAGFAAIGGLRRGEAMTLLVPAILGGFDRRRRIRIGHGVGLPYWLIPMLGTRKEPVKRGERLSNNIQVYRSR